MKNEMNAKVASCMAMIERLDLQIQKAKHEKEDIQKYIAACERSAELFGAVKESTDNPHEHFLKIKLRKDSRAFKVRNILLANGSPMHVEDIYRKLFNEEPLNAHLNSLRGNLNGFVQQLRVFTRPEPMTYGLMEWGK